METILLEEMTWTMVQDAMNDGYKTVIMAVGSIEQHGPHLPVSTDVHFGDCLAKHVAEKLGNTLVAPTIKPGCSSHHMHFPGTISLEPETLIAVLKDSCRSLDKHGFKNIILLPSHGGNFAPVATAVQSIAMQLNANLINAHKAGVITTSFKKAVAETGADESSVGGHAGAGETSFILAYKPGLVRREDMKKGYVGPSTQKYVRTGIKSVTPSGIFGDPTVASREAGEKLIEYIVDALVKLIKRELES
jgi:creatinine amidohydrolase